MERRGRGGKRAVGGQVSHLVVTELVETGVVMGMRIHASDDVDVAEEEAGLEHEVYGLKMVVLALRAKIRRHHHASSCRVVTSQRVWTTRVEVVILCVLARVPWLLLHFPLPLLAKAALLAWLLPSAP